MGSLSKRVGEGGSGKWDKIQGKLDSVGVSGVINMLITCPTSSCRYNHLVCFYYFVLFQNQNVELLGSLPLENILMP